MNEMKDIIEEIKKNIEQSVIERNEYKKTSDRYTK